MAEIKVGDPDGRIRRVIELVSAKYAPIKPSMAEVVRLALARGFAVLAAGDAEILAAALAIGARDVVGTSGQAGGLP